MLKFDNVSVKAGKTTLLRNISFEAHTGITALIGVNGSGKSTLLRCAAGLIGYTGCVIACGKDISSISRRETARLISFMPQSPIPSSLSVRALISLGRMSYTGIIGRLGKIDIDIINKAMETVSLSGFENRSCDTLSGGELRRAYIALSLAQEVDVLLFDEPTAGLDARGRKEIWELMSRLAASGKTILIATHDLGDAAITADSAVILERGCVVYSGSMEACLSENAIEKALGTRKYECEGRLFFE